MDDSGKTTLILSKTATEDMKIIKSLKDLGILIKAIVGKIQN